MTHKSHIWGAGFISSQQELACKPEAINLVRGVLSRNKVIKSGITNALAVGDPALMLPLVYSPKIKSKYRLGIILHYSEKPLLKLMKFNPDIKIIDVQQDVESFINELLECETILSSSLHGLIFADAYGVPNHWIKVSNKLSGDDFKFADYYSVLYGNKNKVPIQVSPNMLDDLISYVAQCSTSDCSLISNNVKNSFQLYD